jgi:hypothetical protein
MDKYGAPGTPILPHFKPESYSLSVTTRDYTMILTSSLSSESFSKEPAARSQGLLM